MWQSACQLFKSFLKKQKTKTKNITQKNLWKVYLIHCTPNPNANCLFFNMAFIKYCEKSYLGLPQSLCTEHLWICYLLHCCKLVQQMFMSACFVRQYALETMIKNCPKKWIYFNITQLFSICCTIIARSHCKLYELFTNTLHKQVLMSILHLFYNNVYDMPD